MRQLKKKIDIKNKIINDMKTPYLIIAALCCGGQRWLPMNIDELCLIHVDVDSDNKNIDE